VMPMSSRVGGEIPPTVVGISTCAFGLPGGAFGISASSSPALRLVRRRRCRYLEDLPPTLEGCEALFEVRRNQAGDRVPQTQPGNGWTGTLVQGMRERVRARSVPNKQRGCYRAGTSMASGKPGSESSHQPPLGRWPP